jgi:hypothetical protein
MPEEELRVGKVRSVEPPGGAVLHIYRVSGEFTLCRAFQIAELQAPGGLDNRICPACADTLSSSTRG